MRQSVLLVKFDHLIQKVLVLKCTQTLLVLAVCIGSLNAMAQSDPNDPTSPNYKKSLATMKTSPWNLSVVSQYGRAMEEFSENYAYYGATLNYRLAKGSLSLSAGYSHPTDLDTDDARPWRFEDVALTYNSPQLRKLSILDKDVSTSARVTYLAPLSETSQYAKTFGTLIGTVNAVASVGRFTFIFSPGLYLSYHEFETADENGVLPNSPVAARLSTTVRAQVYRKLSASLSAYIHNYWDYEVRFKQVQGVSSSLIYQATSKLNVNAFASWRDRVVTNNSLFDDDTVQTGLGITYTF